MDAFVGGAAQNEPQRSEDKLQSRDSAKTNAQSMAGNLQKRRAELSSRGSIPYHLRHNSCSERARIKPSQRSPRNGPVDRSPQQTNPGAACARRIAWHKYPEQIQITAGML